MGPCTHLHIHCRNWKHLQVFQYLSSQGLVFLFTKSERVPHFVLLVGVIEPGDLVMTRSLGSDNVSISSPCFKLRVTHQTLNTKQPTMSLSVVEWSDWNTNTGCPKKTHFLNCKSCSKLPHSVESLSLHQKISRRIVPVY